MQIEFRYMPDHLLAVVTGEYELAQAVDSFRVGLGRCKDKGYENFLVDYRGSSPTTYATEKVIFTMEVLDLYRKYASGLGQQLRVAYLTVPEHLSVFEPGHDLVKIFGLPIKIFTDLGEIKTWLKSEDSQEGALELAI